MERSYYFGHFAFKIEQDQSQFLCYYVNNEVKMKTRDKADQNNGLNDNKNYGLNDNKNYGMSELFNGEIKYPGSQFCVLKKILSSASNYIIGENFNLTVVSRELEDRVISQNMLTWIQTTWN